VTYIIAICVDHEENVVADLINRLHSDFTVLATIVLSLQRGTQEDASSIFEVKTPFFEGAAALGFVPSRKALSNVLCAWRASLAHQPGVLDELTGLHDLTQKREWKVEKQSHAMFGPARRESKAFKDLPPVQCGEIFHADWVRFAGTAGPYLLPPLRLFDPTVSAISIKRRIASEREGLSFCCLAQFSMANRVLGGSRTVRTGSRPVAGRPGLLGMAFSVDRWAMFW
jgi:hypothetical protein